MRTDGCGKQILIVDDERLVRWLLRQKCEEWGYRVLEAEAGEPALKLAQQGGTSLEEIEHAMVELAMKQANHNQTHAANLLDITRDALRYKLKKFGLNGQESEEFIELAGD